MCVALGSLSNTERHCPPSLAYCAGDLEASSCPHLLDLREAGATQQAVAACDRLPRVQPGDQDLQGPGMHHEVRAAGPQRPLQGILLAQVRQPGEDAPPARRRGQAAENLSLRAGVLVLQRQALSGLPEPAVSAEAAGGLAHCSLFGWLRAQGQFTADDERPLVQGVQAAGR
jgi:hypothetical protein